MEQVELLAEKAEISLVVREVISLQLSVQQINNLCTGVKLATELKSDNSKLRKFLTIQSYNYSVDGKIIALGKVIKPNILDNIYFELRCYELSIDYYLNDWDVTEDDLVSNVYKDEIKGIEVLEMELSNYIQDYSILKPEWYCDNLL